jgi:hypothetical protein
MRIQIDRAEAGTTVSAKETPRRALIRRVITCCQPDGFSILLFEKSPTDEVPHGYCHIPAWRSDATTAERLESAASRWVSQGLLPPACESHAWE